MPPEENTSPTPTDNPIQPEPVVEEITPPNPLLQQEGEPVPLSAVDINPAENVTEIRTPETVTITEVMTPTAQMAGNEPLEIQRSDFASPSARATPDRQENLNKANLTRQNKKRKKIDEIMTMFLEKPTITNDEVEKLLHVSDATATRYLETLEKEGKIRQVGKTGEYTHYEKI